MEVRNEFAAVRIALDTTANAPRLRIEDLETGAVAYIDAFVLRSLCLVPPQVLEALCRLSLPQEAEPGPQPPAV